MGAASREALVQAGATVITASRSLERNCEYAEALRKQGYDAHGMQLDITDPNSITHLRDRIIAEFGRIDILVNSALARVGGSFESQTFEDWIANYYG